MQRVRAHLLRHTFATSYMIQVGNLEFLRMYLGHSTYNVTLNYIQSAYQCNLLKYDIYKIDNIFT
ncbi:MAG: tyrosine-type recombinase/integrase [Lachnospiraceae bacterium]|nr:tyrosine-type recombinase/integrase [Lachnospiraceae bacterium]MBO6298954.1 tyrosine-type recombinase/integrase [Lachnospiraceae bacterium]MBP3297668.1 tyrosine-type recombinase/integrase [Lachnospiraceae bacterium]